MHLQASQSIVPRNQAKVRGWKQDSFFSCTVKHNSVCFVILYSCPSVWDSGSEKDLQLWRFPWYIRHFASSQLHRGRDNNSISLCDITQLFFTVIYESRHVGDKAVSSISPLSSSSLYTFVIFSNCSGRVVLISSVVKRWQIPILL